MPIDALTRGRTLPRDIVPPTPVADFAWDADRARSLGTEVVALWGELLERLPSMPVGGRATAAEVRASVTRDVPNEPVSP